MSDFKSVDAEYQLRETVGPAYSLCGSTCLGGVLKWSIKKKISLKHVRVLIERGDDRQGELIDARKREGLKVVAVASGASSAFQAADMVAWKSRIAIQNAQSIQSVEDGENILRSLDPIKALLHNNGVHDTGALRKMCLRSGMPRRLEFMPMKP